MKRFPTLQSELAAAATEALEKFREESRKTSLRLVDMEASYLTVDFFRKLPQEIEKGGNPVASTMERYTEGHLRRIGKLYIHLGSPVVMLDQAFLHESFFKSFEMQLFFY